MEKISTEMETKQELIGKYLWHFCPLHGRVTKFFLTEDAESHIVCSENCCYRTVLKETPREEDIQIVPIENFYAKLMRIQKENEKENKI